MMNFLIILFLFLSPAVFAHEIKVDLSLLKEQREYFVSKKFICKTFFDIMPAQTINLILNLEDLELTSRTWCIVPSKTGTTYTEGREIVATHSIAKISIHEGKYVSTEVVDSVVVKKLNGGISFNFKEDEFSQYEKLGILGSKFRP